MGHYFTNVQGRPDDMGARVLRRRITYNQAGFNSAGGIPIGAIEKGGVVIRAIAVKNVPFSNGATVTLGNVGNASTGQQANPAGFMASSDVNPTSATVGTVGSSTTPGGPSLDAEMPNDTIVYAYLGGTVATAGDVTFLLEYVPAYNWSDLNGGQAS